VQLFISYTGADAGWAEWIAWQLEAAGHQRLTPSNHDELLFDDVLWVERAQYEHDQFVARMRERGVEVFQLRDLLAEALAASDEGRRRLVELAASEYTVGLSLVDEVRAVLWDMKPDQLAKHLIGGLTVAEAGRDLGRFRALSLPAAALEDTSAFILPPLPNTLFIRDSSAARHLSALAASGTAATGHRPPQTQFRSRQSTTWVGSDSLASPSQAANGRYADRLGSLQSSLLLLKHAEITRIG
jgi:Arginine deiminase